MKVYAGYFIRVLRYHITLKHFTVSALNFSFTWRLLLKFVSKQIQHQFHNLSKKKRRDFSQSERPRPCSRNGEELKKNISNLAK
jgi:hypothetical protein